ncbi:MAG: hypothetical protein FWB88_01455 [Defluviitaleaceae bacterium]|nr:hypothetical protein [Defluviitaleaceae bacterium]MCL2238937.1 hypothetical protein [Defluviitaleaceae bacterium]
MNQRIKHRQNTILGKYPDVNAAFEKICNTRREEIINTLLASDADYQALTKHRAETSQVVLEFLRNHDMTHCFEAYSDAVFEEELYELDAIYKEAFLDAVELMEQKQFNSHKKC